MADIEIRIRSLEQLVESLDPAPFYDKSLDPDAERYLLECAEELAGAAHLRLVVHAPAALRAHEADIVAAVHGHFRREHALAERRYRLRMRVGRRAMVGGSIALLGALALREALLPFADPARIVGVLAEGLLILGWVALWRPVEALIYERRELRQRHAALERLARIPVELRVTDELPQRQV
jgi:hypothetical protein